jgi:polar amino acid transport system substrate-binding protein
MKILMIVMLWAVMSGSALAGSDVPITVAAGLTVEPYVIETDNGGFEVDIVRAAFQEQGFQVRFLYQPLLRSKISFEQGTVDGVMTVKDHYPEVRNAFVSDEYITYHNVAISLSSRGLVIASVADLAGKPVDAFQQARLGLGPDFRAMADGNPQYHEMANQRHQIAKLFAGRTDIIILDQRIFKYCLNTLTRSSDRFIRSLPVSDPVTVHNLFEPSHYRMAFRTKEMRDAFNAGLATIRADGRYDRIIATYFSKN